MFFSTAIKPPTRKLEINQVPAIMLSYATLIKKFQCREKKKKKKKVFQNLLTLLLFFVWYKTEICSLKRCFGI